MADGKFDDLLLGLAKQHKTVEELMYSLLSFFERRTDLFHIMETPTERMGFMPGAAEKMFFKHFHHMQQRYFSRCQTVMLGRTLTPALPDGTSQASQPASSAQATSASSGSTGETSSAPAIAAPSASSRGAAQTNEPTVDAGADEPEPDAECAIPEETKKKMRHISTWNGAITDKYYWSQSLREVTLEVEVDEGARAKDMQVNVTATRLSIKCKGRLILEGKLHEKVTVEETMWHIEENNQLVMSLEKQRETWWKCVLEGDPEIDTTKVESTRSMEEYDGETQGAIRKIMFDQNQKMMGKPNSDQIRTAEVMKDAWNAPGSPFRGSEFDPTLLNLSGPVPDDFFAGMEQKRIEEAQTRKAAGGYPAGSSSSS